MNLLEIYRVLFAKVVHMNEGMVSAKTNPTLVNETANFELSMLSSLVPDGSSAVSTSPLLHRHANTDLYSYLNLPPLPLPVLPSSLSSSGSSTVDGSSTGQETTNLGLKSSQTPKRKQQQGGVQLDLFTTTEVHKKARLDMKQDPIVQQQNVLRSIPKLGGVETEKLQQVVPQAPAAYPLDSGVCSRRIMQYLYHLRHRPSDNGIAFWRKFVAEYFAPCAKKRWCLSLYDNVGNYAPGVFPQAAMDTWQCDVCGSKSGRGFEANFESLPRLNKIMFKSGVIDELLYIDMPCEVVQISGLMMLEYGKAVQESIYEQFRVIREGKLRVIFAPDLKILSWEFCAWHHEELLPQSLVAPQINKLIHTVQRYQSSVDFNGSDGVSPHELQANCNTFLVAGCQLVRNLELQPIDNFGFPKRYIRCLQISEIINSMKDLMTFSLDKNTGAIESLKKYSQETSTTKPLKNELQGKESAHDLSIDRRMCMATSPLLNKNENDSSKITGCGHMTDSEEAMVSPGYFVQLLRPNSLNLDMSKVIPEPSSSYNRSKLGASSKSLQGPQTSNPGHTKNLLFEGLSSSHSSECKQKMQDNLIQKLLQKMISNSGTANRGSELEKVNHKNCCSTGSGLPASIRGIGIDGYKVAFKNSTAAHVPLGKATNNIMGKINASTAAANLDPSGIRGSGSFSKREQYLPLVIRNMVCGYNADRISDGNCGD